LGRVVPGYFLIPLFTIAAAALTGQRIVASKAIRVIVSFFLSFFCHSDVMVTQSANSSWGWLCMSCLVPVKNQMLQSLMILVLHYLEAWTFRYSQDLIAKKIPMVASWAVACSRSALSCLVILLITDIEIAFWCFSSGLVFLNDLYSYCRMKADSCHHRGLGLGVHSCERSHIHTGWYNILDCVCNQLFMR
jgi:hypothetical protein